VLIRRELSRRLLVAPVTHS